MVKDENLHWTEAMIDRRHAVSLHALQSRPEGNCLASASIVLGRDQGGLEV